MHTEQPIAMGSVLAAADLAKFRFVGRDGNYAQEDGFALGVVNAETGQGKYAPYMYVGIAIVEAAGAISAEAEVAVSDDDGKAKAADALAVEIPSDSTPVTSDAAQPTLDITGGSLPQRIVGVALDAAVNPGDLIRVMLK